MRIIFRCDPAFEGRLLRPVPARAALPDWLRDMPRSAHSAAHAAELRTVKHCPPFIDAMSHGFIIPLPCDVRVKGGTLSWDWDMPPPEAGMHPRAPISFHVPEQVTGTPLFHSGQIVVKFNSFWTVELEAGWSLFATHPANREDLPHRLLTGLVDADRFHNVGILFPALWLDPDFEGVLPKGMPIAQCFAVPRAAAELVFETFDRAQVASYDKLATALLSSPGVYRKHFRAGRAQ
jgi:hypothetical protein